jgi:adenylosuccinate lyase
MSENLEGGDIGQLLATIDYSPIPNIAAYRWASDPAKRIWSPEGTILAERFSQISIMQAQADLGVDIPQANIDDYRAVIGDIDTAAILEEERVSKHDVNARIVVFNRQAGHQNIGTAMTSRDSTDPAEQLQKRLSLELFRLKTVAAIGSFARASAAYAAMPLTGRTHNVAAQMTTLGKRISMTGEELIDGYNNLAFHINGLKFRGIKGAVGTQQDMLDLFEGDEGKVDELEERVARELGFNAIYNSVGQIYPRSQDLMSIQALSHVVGPLSNFGTNVRLMMGGGLMLESTRKRVGSNAMPHKINPRTVERIVGMYSILGGYEFMLRPKAGEQWLEGDVSDSAPRRVALPDSFLVADGAMEAGLTVLNGFGLFEQAISAEVDANLPFLATTKVLTGAIKRGMGREDAHEKIRDHAFAVVRDMREGGQTENDLLERLGSDPAIPLTYSEIIEAIGRPIDLTGRADTQVQRFVAQADKITSQFPQAALYKPGDIL